MGIRHNFKLAVATRFVDELPDDLKTDDDVSYVLPDFPTDGMKGKKEWVHLRVYHNTSRRLTIGPKGARRFNRRGRIAIQIYTEPGVGPKRADDIAEIIGNMFEGRSLPGFSVVFTNCEPRETGLDNDGRYNVTLAEVEFEYRVRK